MAEKDFTTKGMQLETARQREFDTELKNARMIITGLAAVGFLMMCASEMESDYTEKFWEDFYRECPWVVSSDLPENGRLSLDL
jgi:hypothetical protein